MICRTFLVLVAVAVLSLPAFAGSVVYPDGGLSGFSPAISSRDCNRGFCIEVVPGCFPTNLRRASNPLSPFSTIQMNFDWKGTFKPTPRFALQFPAGMTVPAKTEYTECQAQGPFRYGRSSKFQCKALHSKDQRTHRCVVKSSSTEASCIGDAGIHQTVTHTCTILGDSHGAPTLLCRHIYPDIDKAIQPKITEIDNSSPEAQGVKAVREGKRVLIYFPNAQPIANNPNPSSTVRPELPEWDISFKQFRAYDAKTLKEANSSDTVQLDVLGKSSKSSGKSMSWIAAQHQIQEEDTVIFKRCDNGTPPHCTYESRQIIAAAQGKNHDEYKLDREITVEKDVEIYRNREFTAPFDTDGPGQLPFRGGVKFNPDSNALEIESTFAGQEGFCDSYHSPLMLFFDGTRPKFTGKSSFPLDPRGQDIHWVEPNAPGHFLALDDGTGRITRADQLFGQSPDAENGFEALKKHDGNKDGMIDAKDPVFAKLLLWNDRNGNGKSEPREIRKPGELGLVAIQLSYSNDVASYGRQAKLKGEGIFVFVDRKTKAIKKGKVLDIWFATLDGN